MPAPSRRRFLNRITVAAGSVALSSFPLAALSHDGDESHAWRGERRAITPGAQFFPQGVASFDPRPASVLLWARLEDPRHAAQDAPLTLLVSTDRSLNRIIAAADVHAHAADDGVVQVKLTGLEPKRHYWYRFVYQHQGKWYGSPIGRTRTAPKERDASPVHFALASCQDAIGRFYNAYLAALPQELDLVVFVGDYIYETTGDPSLQNPTGRRIEFSDRAGAITLKNAAGATFYAASSLSNYRELYRFYRSDPLLQRMHQRFAFVNIWDDHEFADDVHGATATYFDGRRDELNVQRRRNAERAFFENIAVDDDLPEGPVDLSSTPLYPESRVYRDFRYGKNLHLVMTDTRTFRPDHLIAEDAFPGTIAVDRAALTALLGAAAYDAVKGNFAPYIDIDLPAVALYKSVLTQVLSFAYAQEGLSPADAAAKAAATARGKLDVNVLNSLFASVPGVPPIAATGLDRGLSFALMGKTTLFSTLGARYFVAKDTYDLYAAYRTLLLRDAGAENLLGDAQLAWLESTLKNSDARWKVVANSISFTSMILDLRSFTQLPAPLRNRFYLNADQFDGFPNFKARLMELYSSVDGVALLAGDIHAAFATEHPGGIWEFTGPAVSSFVFFDGLRAAVLADPTLGKIPGIDQLVAQLDALLTAGNPAIRYVNTKVNGVVVLEASAARLSATYWQLDGSATATSYYEQPLALAGKLSVKQFNVSSAARAAARS
jgi:alkaline phosphatase D